MEKKLYRDQQHKVIGGVCAGLADYFNIDVSIVRVLFLASLILKGGGFLIYIVLMIVLPKKDYIFNDPTVDYKVPPDPLGYKPNDPFVAKRKTNGSMIAGAVLIIIGSFFLLNELDFIPDFDFELIWPVVLIVVGLVFILSRPKRQPWKDEQWNKPETETKNDAPGDTTINDNPPTV